MKWIVVSLIFLWGVVFCQVYECGDVNGDGNITSADAAYIIQYIYKEGPEPRGNADVNSDGRITAADATYLTAYIYRGGPAPCASTGMVIDHLCSDLSQIPSEHIELAKTCNMYYVHTSHGGQIAPDGLEHLEWVDPTYSVNIGNLYLPVEAGAFCVYDRGGDPKDFWLNDGEGSDGAAETRAILTAHPTINIAAFCWCGQMNYKPPEYVQAYCETLSVLDAEFPNVTFIYITGNAQRYGLDGWTRYQNNNIIRDYCRAHGKVLFDFADIDSWWWNGSEWEQATMTYDGNEFPVQDYRYEGDDCGHADWSLCELKARAFWYMLARLSGWGG